MRSEGEFLANAVEGSVATVTFNRPDLRNAASNEMLRELFGVVSEVASRDDLAVLMLTGTGRFFSPGASLAAVSDGVGMEMEAGEPAAMYDIASLLHEMPQLTIAAINGGCAGAGLGLACGCDLRVAAGSAKFTTAFLNIGLPGDLCLPWLLPRIVGPARARQLSFMPDKFDAQEAAAWGLVSQVFPEDTFEADVAAFRDRFAAMNPSAIRVLKQRYLDADRMDLATYARHEARSNAAFFSAFPQSVPAEGAQP